MADVLFWNLVFIYTTPKQLGIYIFISSDDSISLCIKRPTKGVSWK